MSTHYYLRAENTKLHLPLGLCPLLHKLWQDREDKYMVLLPGENVLDHCSLSVPASGYPGWLCQQGV